MPRTRPSHTLALGPRERDQPAARWLVAALRAAILDGRLRTGARLPATRAIASEYALARGTVVRSFEQLGAEGYLQSRTGSGTFVSNVLPDRLLSVAARGAPRRANVPAPSRRETRYAAGVRPLGNLHGPARAFRANQPALDLFPTALWASVAGRRMRRATIDLLMATPPTGYPPLQRAIAEHLGEARGVVCEPGQVVIVSGAQEALDLITRLFVDPGDRVAIEDPGYAGAARIFAASGARVVHVRVDEEGMMLDRQALRGVRLAYVTPAHQFPTGVSMSLSRRLALLEWASATQALIIEDDYDSEYRYTGRPLPSMQGLDGRACVLFVGSFSKVLFPSLRLGYVVVPADLVDRFAAARSITARHAPLLDQAVLADFIAEGHFGRHVRRMREVYASRWSALSEGVARELAGALTLSPVDAGLQTPAWLTRRGVRAREIVARAAERKVEVVALDRYAHGRSVRDGLLLGFAAVDEREIARGVTELARIL